MHENSNTFADIRFAINRRIKPDAYRSSFTIIFTSLSKEDEDAAFYLFYSYRQRNCSETMRLIILVVK